MTTPSAIRIKETTITWKHLVVLTTESPEPNLLHPYEVRVEDDAGKPISLAARFATRAAAEHEHQKLVRGLTTGTLPKKAMIEKTR